MQYKREQSKIVFFDDHICIASIDDAHTWAGCSVIEDELVDLGNGCYKWTRFFSIDNDAEAPTVAMELIAHYHVDFWMIPAVSYNGNHWGSGNEPKGFGTDQGVWTFACHRSSIPGATVSAGNGYAVALFGEYRERTSGFSCSLEPKEACTCHRLVFPEQESPASYTRRDTFSPAYREARINNSLFKATAYVVIASVANEDLPYKKVLDFAWSLRRPVRKPRLSDQTVWNYGIGYALNALWADEGEFHGFSIGLTRKNDSWVQREDWKYEIAWCGQNLSLALSLIHEYILHEDQTALKRGLQCLDTWVDAARLDNGLLRCHFDYLLGIESRRPEVQDGCNLGNAAVILIEAYELLNGKSLNGVDPKKYLDAALALCTFMVECQEADGRYGRAWDNEGNCVDREGGTGAFLIEALAEAYRISGNKAYLKAAEKGYAFYYTTLKENGFSTAGALDTHCVDKESAIPLLKAGLRLFRATQNQDYLQKAGNSAYYLSTWQWHYSTDFPADSILGQIGYDTFGGTAVSVQHHHIDPYAVCYVADLHLLAEYSGNPVWKERAEAIWNNALYGISDGSLVIDGMVRPQGSQDEGFFHTRWANMGGTSLWLVAWPTAFRLESLRRMGIRRQPSQEM